MKCDIDGCTNNAEEIGTTMFVDINLCKKHYDELNLGDE